ncbi:MAG: LON peptidase substrate-binding domain-containing protein [Chloroflexota bacterium]
MTDPQLVLPLFPLGQVVLYPGMSLPLRIFEERYKMMMGACQVTDQLFGGLLIRSGSEVGQPAEPERVGCTARMLRVDRLPDGQMIILSVGEARFRLVGRARVMPEGYLVGDSRILADETSHPIAADLLSSVAEEFGTYQARMLAATDGAGLTSPAALPSDPVQLSYRVAATLQVHPRERQHLLELNDVTSRLQQELSMLRRENRPLSIGPFSIN